MHRFPTVGQVSQRIYFLDVFVFVFVVVNRKERDISFADELKMQNTRMSPPWGRNSIKGNSAAEKNEN